MYTSTRMVLIALHLLYWTLGFVVIKRCWPGPGSRILSCRSPHWFAAWFLGLAVNTIAAFTLNQFLKVTISTGTLCVIASALLLASLALLLTKPDALSIDEPDRRSWSFASAIVFGLVIASFTANHAEKTWAPLTDWDTFQYHLPLGKLISQGDFSSDISSSQLKRPAAFPPLFFFVYGLNAQIADGRHVFAAAKITLIAVNAFTAMTVYFLARDRFGCRPFVSLIAVFCAVMSLNAEPNIQSFTTIYFLLGLYYALPWLTSGFSDRTFKALAPGVLFFAGCYWANYVGVVLTGLFFGASMIAILINKRRNNVSTITFRAWMLASVTLTVLVLPHLIRNWLVAGNPIYPAMPGVLGGIGMNEWVHQLSTPTVQPWHEFRSHFHYCLPLSALIFAGIVSNLYLKRTSIEIRTTCWIIAIGYMAVWFAVLNLSGTPTWRYLFPLAFMMILLVASHIDETWTRATWPNMIGLTHLIVTALWIVNPRIGSLGFWIPIVIVIAVIPLMALFTIRLRRPIHGWLVFVLLTPTIGCLIYSIASLFAFQRMWQTWTWPVLITIGFVVAAWSISTKLKSIESKRHLRTTATALAAITIFSVMAFPNARWQNLNIYRVAVDHYVLNDDFYWMNTHLPQDAVVLTIENRMFTLDRDVIPVDDYRLESFFKSESIDQFRALRDLKITHVYWVDGHKDEEKPLYQKRSVWPGDNPNVESLHEREHSWIARIRWEHISPALDARP